MRIAEEKNECLETPAVAPLNLPTLVRMATDSVGIRESLRENRVNQSGSVALSAEGVRGPPSRNLLIIMALLTQKSGYEPGGRGFESCRARQNSRTYEP
jgi:hypothetical protein